MNGFSICAVVAPLLLIVITTASAATANANANANNSILIEDFSDGPINKWTTMNGKVKYTFVHLFLPLLLLSAECFVCFTCMYTIDISFSSSRPSIHPLLFFSDQTVFSSEQTQTQIKSYQIKLRISYQ